MKLFAINIVAKSLLGSLSKVLIFFSLFLSMIDKLCKSLEFNEKNDTSDPETKADKKTKKATNNNPRIRLILK